MISDRQQVIVGQREHLVAYVALDSGTSIRKTVAIMQIARVHQEQVDPALICQSAHVLRECNPVAPVATVVWLRGR